MNARENLDVPIHHFEDADALLLYEARARFEFEQKIAVALQSKSAFFLTVATALTGLVGTAIWKLVDKPSTTQVEAWALCILVLSLLAFAGCMVLLARSSISLSYQVVASPTDWRRHLHDLRTAYSGATGCESCAATRLRFDMLDAWIEAADAGYTNNKAKARLLGLTAKLLMMTVPLTVLAMVILAVPQLRR